MDYKISGTWGNYKAATEAEDVYLRLERKADMVSGYYAVEPDQWERLGRFGNYFKFTRVGLGVSNVHAAEDVVGQVDCSKSRCRKGYSLLTSRKRRN